MSKFGAIPTAIICRFGELTKTEIIVLSYLYSARNSQSGVCNPRQKTIAMMTGINKTHVSAAIKNLANRGWISMDNDGQFMLIDAPKKVTKFVTKSYGIGNSEVTKSVTKVTDSVTKSYEIGNLHNIDINNERNNEVTTKETGTEMLKDHEVIVAIRDVVHLFPPAKLWPALVEELGDWPIDVDRLQRCHVEWLSNGYNPTNYAWARDWYRNGIPKERGGRGTYALSMAELARRNTSIIPVDQVTAPVIAPTPIRPAADCPPEQRELWRAVLAEIRRQVGESIYRTWFDPLVFDGLNEGKNAFLVRTNAISHDWIMRYYAETIYQSLIAAGLSEFTLSWEIEGEVMEAVGA